ncbi:MAG: hypothetical protein PHO54_00690 [Candidatus Peribacteraceae bacterium]|nr:hypothetical protein [Candidatus Peribacteraceae bacterium]
MSFLRVPFRLSWLLHPLGISCVLLVLCLLLALSTPSFRASSSARLAQLLPTGSSSSSVAVDKLNPLLSPCSRYDTRFENLPFKSKNFNDWPKEYHDKVQAVVEEHLKFSSQNVRCSSGDLDSFLQPQSKLQALAQSLPTWKGPNSPSLKQTDVGVVLMEFLNVYECALKERFFFLPLDSLQFLKQQSSGRSSSAMPHSSLLPEMEQELSIIRRELALSRKTLTRTLAIIGGMNRLLPLDLELQCMAGISMDLRNASALAAEASACLPRVWNAKDSFRDLKESP